MIKCPYCESDDYEKVHGSGEYYCNYCGIAFDDKHIELMNKVETQKADNKKLKEELIEALLAESTATEQEAIEYIDKEILGK